jgi:hypothetical protein
VASAYGWVTIVILSMVKRAHPLYSNRSVKDQLFWRFKGVRLLLLLSLKAFQKTLLPLLHTREGLHSPRVLEAQAKGSIKTKNFFLSLSLSWIAWIARSNFKLLLLSSVCMRDLGLFSNLLLNLSLDLVFIKQFSDISCQISK